MVNFTPGATRVKLTIMQHLSLTVFYCNSNSMEISLHTHLDWNTAIATEFCAWHDNCADMACTKFRCDLMASNRIIAKLWFQRIWIARKISLVKRTQGTNSSEIGIRIHVLWLKKIFEKCICKFQVILFRLQYARNNVMFTMWFHKKMQYGLCNVPWYLVLPKKYIRNFCPQSFGNSIETVLLMWKGLGSYQFTHQSWFTTKKNWLQHICPYFIPFIGYGWLRARLNCLQSFNLPQLLRPHYIKIMALTYQIKDMYSFKMCRTFSILRLAIHVNIGK